jgi:SAM-dependent methyltransferase
MKNAGSVDYDYLADIYDGELGKLSNEWLPAVELLVLNRLQSSACVLDVCCGTGQMAGILAGRGYRVTGIDISSGMLEKARINAPGAEFKVCDVRSFSLDTSFDAAISLSDSFNHLVGNNDLKNAFGCVSSVLKRNAVFLFDLRMEEGYLNGWNIVQPNYVEDNRVCVLKTKYDSEIRLGNLDVIIFDKSDTSWERSDIAIRQRCYSKDEVFDSLSSAGFDNIHAMKLEDFGVKVVGRYLFHCTKKRD